MNNLTLINMVVIIQRELLKEVDDVDEKLREKTIEVEQLGDGVARTWQNSISENAMKVGEMLSVMTEEDRKGCKIYGPIGNGLTGFINNRQIS